MRRKEQFSRLSIALAIWCLPYAAHAVGLAPAETVVGDMLNNSSVEREILISRGDASASEQVMVEFRGEAASAMTAPQGSEVTLPPGESIVRYPISIESGDLPAGDYEVFVVVTPVPPEQADATSSGQTIVTGAQGKILFSVTNDEREVLTAANLRMNDTESDQPIGFQVQLQNEGNVATRPSSIDIRFVNRNDASQDFSVPVDVDEFDFIDPYSTQEIEYVTDTTIPEGVYQVFFTVYNNAGEPVYTVTPDADAAVEVQVFPPGTLARNGELISVFTDKEEYQAGEIAQLTALFQNTGEIDVVATFSTDIFVGDRRVEVLTSDEVFVARAAEEELSVDLRIEEGGEYRVRGSVNYGLRETDAKETTFQVRSLSGNTILLILGVGTGILILVFATFRHRKKTD